MHQTKKKPSRCTNRGPHVLKLAFQDLRDASDGKKISFSITYLIKLRTQLLRSLRLL